MCIVSMVFDRYKNADTDKWTISSDGTAVDNYKTWRTATIGPKQIESMNPIELFEELIKITKELDNKLGLADCEDPEKAKFLDRIRDIVKEYEVNEIEKQLKKLDELKAQLSNKK